MSASIWDPGSSVPVGLVTVADLASTHAGKGGDMVGFSGAGAGSVNRTMLEKARERISVSDYLTDAELAAVQAGASALDVSIAVRRAVVAGAGRDVWFDAPGTYYMATPDSGAYITLSTMGTRLRLEKNARLRFADAAVYGINITAQLCGVEGGLLWGTNTTAPTITAIVRVDGNNSEVIGSNIAYGAIGTHIDGTYIIKHERNSYSHCDTYFKTSGSCADIESKGNTYGTSAIGTGAAVDIAGSGGADLHDYWEQQGHGKLALKCVTGGQRVQVRGKFFDSGGIDVQSSVYLRLDAEMLDSYTGTVGIDVKPGGSLDATGSYLNGPGSTSGVEAINGDGVVIMGAGTITEWQVAADINSIVAIGNVLVSQCTTAWDVATAASGTIVDCAYSGVTNKLVRTSSATVSVPDIFVVSDAWTPGLIAAGGEASRTVTVTGARLGDGSEVSYDQNLGGCTLHHQVLTDSVVVRISNPTAGGITPTPGNLRVRVSTRSI